MAKVEYADLVKTVSGALTKINKHSQHASDQKMVLATHRVAPTTSHACSRVFLRGLSSVTHSKPATQEQLARQLRFKTISASVAARMKDPAKMIQDQAAFNAQSIYTTMKKYLWALEKASYDQQLGQ